jgi:aspartyl protease family protein
MLRAYLFIVVGIGIAVAMVGHARAPAPPAPKSVQLVESGAADREPAYAQAMTGGDDGSIELRRDSNGHFYADVEINNTPVHMLVDTGASGIALSREDARKAGVATSIGMNDVIGEGASGSVRGEYVTIDRIAWGPATAERVPAAVLDSGSQSLLGQEFLRKFASVEIRGDRMRLSAAP